MSEIDDLLNTVGIPSTTQIASRVQETTENAPTIQSMSNEAFDEVLNELGFNDNSEDTEEIEEREEIPLTPMSEEDVLEACRQVAEDNLRQGVSSVESTIQTGNGILDQINQDYEVRVDTAVDTSLLDAAIEASLASIELSQVDSPTREVIEALRAGLESISDTRESAIARLDIPEDHQTIEVQEDANHIEPNSPTLLLDATTSRFSGTEWYNEIQKKSVILAGLGGVGSHFCFQLARMNIAKLVLYDDDIVEPANMSGQLYGTVDVGKLKVDAMASAITNYTSMRNVYAIGEKFTKDSEAGDVMICGFDSMAARNNFFKLWYEHVQSKPENERKNCLFIDGRLDVSMLQVLCVRGDDEYNIERYRKEFLFTDHAAEHTVCSMKQTTYLACMIGSIMVNLFTNWVAGLLNPIIPYDLPFFTAYEAQNMLFNTEN